MECLARTQICSLIVFLSIVIVRKRCAQTSRQTGRRRVLVSCVLRESAALVDAIEMRALQLLLLASLHRVSISRRRFAHASAAIDETGRAAMSSTMFVACGLTKSTPIVLMYESVKLSS